MKRSCSNCGVVVLSHIHMMVGMQWRSQVIGIGRACTCCKLNHCASNTSARTHMSEMNFGRAHARPGLAFATPLWVCCAGYQLLVTCGVVVLSHIHMMVGMLCRQVHSLRAKLTPSRLILLSNINPKMQLMPGQRKQWTNAYLPTFANIMF